MILQKFSAVYRDRLHRMRFLQTTYDVVPVGGRDWEGIEPVIESLHNYQSHKGAASPDSTIINQNG